MSDAARIDGYPVYEWNDYQNENGGVQSVSEVPEGVTEITTYGGDRVPVKAGDLIAQTTRPDQYVKVESLDGWVARKRVDGVDAYVAPDKPAYDPEEHTVTEVKAYLQEQREAGNEDEFDRVIESEQDSKNRAGVVSQTW